MMTLKTNLDSEDEGTDATKEIAWKIMATGCRTERRDASIAETDTTATRIGRAIARCN